MIFMLEYLALTVIIITVFFDSLRDGFMHNKNWWRRHIVKWLQFYVPILFVMIVHLDWKWWIILPIPCWIIWQLTLRYIAGVEWESIWFRLAKKVLTKRKQRYTMVQSLRK